MKNFVGRDIPDCLLVGGREVYQGKNAKDGVYFTKAGPRVRRCEKPVETKVVPTLKEALLRCGAHDGMTVSFHHHLRDGDYVVNLTVATLFEELGLKDITIAATSLGSAHDPVAEYIRQGKVVGIQTSGIRGKVGEAVSRGELKTPPSSAATVAAPGPSRPGSSTSTSPLWRLPLPIPWATAGAWAARATAAPWVTP